MRVKEIEVTYTNWNADEIILDLARRINEGFSIVEGIYNHSLSSVLTTTVRLVARPIYE